MTRKRIILIVAGVICVFLLSCSDKKPEGKTEDKTDRWVSFGQIEEGILYYDKTTVTNVSPNIIMVWTRVKLSKIGKDLMIQDRKDNNQSIEGWDKLDRTMFLMEVDCMNNTTKKLELVCYNNEGSILSEDKISNMQINRVRPESMAETILRTVCPK